MSETRICWVLLESGNGINKSLAVYLDREQAETKLEAIANFPNEDEYGIAYRYLLQEVPLYDRP